MISLYQPGDTVLHRLGAGPKLAALLVAGVAVTLTTGLGWLGAAALLALAILAVARPPAGLIRSQAIGLAFVTALILALSALAGVWRDGVIFVLRVVALVSLATAVTVTTRTSAIQDLIEDGLTRFGPAGRRGAERLGLAIALVIRFVPELVAHAGALDEARKARGLKASAPRLLVPLLVRTLRTADAVAEALDARGYPGTGPSRAPVHPAPPTPAAGPSSPPLPEPRKDPAS
ncbi:energy-coupling factor transporter transmembrane component T family protein [Mongoliimonas terrestris]|uniref:energy-coupling factor transporter transmembrane component T family protein n=1 Tax=Mongoliimonas terrestris TaxID=1709001 RepID=UPI0009498C26|nr:energy-coupling factor transporter transmembrane protein EcfT [Mongoliimonas terrestris]